jgi:hypothetical protein
MIVKTFTALIKDARIEMLSLRTAELPGRKLNAKLNKNLLINPPAIWVSWFANPQLESTLHK